MTLAETNAFTKEVIQPGCGLHNPNEGASCKVLITPNPDLTDAENIIGYPVNVECEIRLGFGIGVMSSTFDKCLESMRSGEQCRIVVAKKPELTGASDNCGWTFTIHLIEFSRGKDVWEMTVEEKNARANEMKELGTTCFKDGRTHQAELFYLRGLKYAIAANAQKDNNQKLLLSLNIAACHLKHKRYQGVIVHCTNALNIDGNSTKALFRRGQAFMELQDYEQAQFDFELCLSLEPSNKAVQKQLELLTGKRRKLDSHYANAMSKMFGGSPSESKP